MRGLEPGQVAMDQGVIDIVALKITFSAIVYIYTMRYAPMVYFPFRLVCERKRYNDHVRLIVTPCTKYY